jgi:DNA-binding Lrp family transcriptional regulator
MITAIILVRVSRGGVATTAEALLEIDGIGEVYSVAGEWDLVAIVRVKRHEDLDGLVTARLATIPKIESTRTLVAFRAYSRKDVQAMWDIGLD